MQTCDLREPGSSGYKGVKDKQASHPRTGITAGEQSKGQKAGQVPPRPVMPQGYQGTLEPCLVVLSVTAGRRQEDQLPSYCSSWKERERHGLRKSVSETEQGRGRKAPASRGLKAEWSTGGCESQEG